MAFPSGGDTGGDCWNVCSQVNEMSSRGKSVRGRLRYGLLVLLLCAARGWAQELIPAGPYGLDGGGEEVISCLVGPSLEVKVGTTENGVLDEVLVDRGDRVKRGQLLARLQSGVERSVVAYQEAKLDFMERKVERSKDLQKGHLISAQEHDELLTDKRLVELDLAERRERLKLRSVASPVDGVIVDRYHSQGDLVKLEEIFRIMRLHPLHVETVWPMRYFGTLKIGQAFTVLTDLKGRQLQAKVSNVDRVVDAASGTFRVRLQAPNPDYKVPAGLNCRLLGYGA